MQCKFCNKECKSLNSLRNHERLCKLNPNRDISDMAAARAKATRPISCVHCTKIFPWNTIRKHENICLSKIECVRNVIMIIEQIVPNRFIAAISVRIMQLSTNHEKIITIVHCALDFIRKNV